jgi:hypothetical protein
MKNESESDALFQLPLADFTAARNTLAARLKKAGMAAEAERVKRLPKPPATAWAVNQLHWRHAKDVERLLVIGEKVRKAQTGKGADLRALLDERRALVSELTMRAATILRDAGHGDSQDALRRMTINLDSLAAWGRSNPDAQPGRLTADLEPLGFDGLAALLDGKKLEPAKVLQFRSRADTKKNEEAAAAARAQALEALKAAEKALTAARREADRAEAEQAKADARLHAIEKQRQDIERLFKVAQEEARTASAEAKKRTQVVAEAERAVERARGAVPR